MKPFWKFIIAIVIFAAAIIGCIFAIKDFNKSRQQGGNSGGGAIVIIPPDQGTIVGSGGDYTSRIVKAGLKLESLNPDEEMPANFDEELFAAFENQTAYLKMIKYEYPNSDWTDYKRVILSDTMLLKLFLDEELTQPIYFLSFKIHHDIFWGWVPNQTYVSYDGQQFELLPRSYKYTDYSFYLKNNEGELIKLRFKAGTRDTSIFATLEQSWNSFKASGKVKHPADGNFLAFYLNSYFHIYKRIDGTFYIQNNNFAMEVEYLNFTRDHWFKHEIITPNDIYKIFPLQSPKPNLNVLYDQNAFQLENFVKYSTWQIDGQALTTPYKMFVSDVFGPKQQIVLKTKVNSDYFVASNLVIEKAEFINPANHPSYGLRFNTEIIEQGIRILSLPHSLQYPAQGSLKYTFRVIQKDENGTEIGVAQSEENYFNYTSSKTFTSTNFFIPFDDNFEILAATKQIIIEMVGIGTPAFEGMNSLIILGGN